MNFDLELTDPHPWHSPGMMVEVSLCKNWMNISRSVICVISWLTRWLFIFSGLTIWPTAESTSAFSSSSLSFTMLSMFKFRRDFSCSVKDLKKYINSEISILFRLDFIDILCFILCYQQYIKDLDFIDKLDFIDILLIIDNQLRNKIEIFQWVYWIVPNDKVSTVLMQWNLDRFYFITK